MSYSTPTHPQGQIVHMSVSRGVTKRRGETTSGTRRPGRQDAAGRDAGHASSKKPGRCCHRHQVWVTVWSRPRVDRASTLMCSTARARLRTRAAETLSASQVTPAVLKTLSGFRSMLTEQPLLRCPRRRSSSTRCNYRGAARRLRVVVCGAKCTASPPNDRAALVGYHKKTNWSHVESTPSDSSSARLRGRSGNPSSLSARAAGSSEMSVRSSPPFRRSARSAKK